MCDLTRPTEENARTSQPGTNGPSEGVNEEIIPISEACATVHGKSTFPPRHISISYIYTFYFFNLLSSFKQYTSIV